MEGLDFVINICRHQIWVENFQDYMNTDARFQVRNFGNRVALTHLVSYCKIRFIGRQFLCFSYEILQNTLLRLMQLIHSASIE